MENLQENLKLRIFWGLIALVLFSIIIYIGSILFTLTIIILAILGLFEYFNICNRLGFRPYKLITILASIILILLSSNKQFIKITLLVFIALFIIFVLSIPIYYNSGRSFEDGAISIYGFLYLSIPAAIFVNLRDMGIEHVIYILGVTWINDAFAFFIGKFFGRTKLAQTISPNKTIEGFFGGLIFSLIFTILFSHIFKFPLLKYIFFSIILSIVAAIGDLSESVMKREANIKDSGIFLPGHGGVLDRVDSLLVNIPVYFILINI